MLILMQILMLCILQIREKYICYLASKNIIILERMFYFHKCKKRVHSFELQQLDNLVPW